MKSKHVRLRASVHWTNTLLRRGGGGVGQPMTENRKIDGKDVKLTLLPGAQVLASSAYSLSGGWDGNLLQDAIVRIWKTQDTKLLDTIETSVGFLKDVRILSFSVGFTIDTGSSACCWIALPLREEHAQ